MARRNPRLRDICGRLVYGRKLLLVANRLYLRHRALSLSFHQFLLQPSIAPRPGRVVTKRFTLSGRFGSLDLHLTLQWALRLLYLGALALSARGLTRHLRARDPRALIAIAAPWLLMFALLGQMHERYLRGGAVVSAVALGASARLRSR